jgi:streptogramin lyase
MTKILSTTKLGSHLINGTEFPMVAELRRFKAPTGRAVYTVAQVCNGEVFTAEDYKLRRDADEHVAGLVAVYATPSAA